MKRHRYMPFAERFWSCVDKSGECWLWTGRTKSRGYGVIRRNGVGVGAHRASYEMHHGPIPSGMMVCHHCDTPLCVRPDHLFIGTAKDNFDDAEAKGRMRLKRSGPCYARGEAHHWHARPDTRGIGERNGRAKLTRADVERIRALVQSGVKRSALAKTYGVSWTAINLIVSGRNWRTA